MDEWMWQLTQQLFTISKRFVDLSCLNSVHPWHHCSVYTSASTIGRCGVLSSGTANNTHRLSIRGDCMQNLLRHLWQACRYLAVTEVAIPPSGSIAEVCMQNQTSMHRKS